jgi:transcriptional regulator with XRE-family HTH domain
MDNRGYSRRVVAANLHADSDNLGVLLGRLCIAHEISAKEVADHLQVSKMTVYSWFAGDWKPRPHHILRIEQFISEIRKTNKGTKK